MTTITAYGSSGFTKTCETVEQVSTWLRIANRMGCTRAVCVGAISKTVFFQ